MCDSLSYLRLSVFFSCLDTNIIEWECEHQTLDRAAPFYQKPYFLSITFTVSKYPSESLGQFFRRLRLERGLEQKQLAKKLRVSKGSVYNWENNRRVPSTVSMERLVKFFRISRKTLEDFKMEGRKSL